jgi:hypothetical protein
MDNLVMERINGCYGQFCNIHSGVLSQEDMKRLVQTLLQTCPEEVALIKKALHIEERIAKNDSIGSIHLIQRYEKMIFWTFYENTRKRNNHLLSPMAQVIAAALFAKSVPNGAQKVAVYFGLSLHSSTFKPKLKHNRMEFDSRVVASLKKYSHHVFTFDNGQRGESLKFQRGGSCNNFY